MTYRSDPQTPTRRPRPNDWRCDNCEAWNPPSEDVCYFCGEKHK